MVSYMYDHVAVEREGHVFVPGISNDQSLLIDSTFSISRVVPKG